MREICSFFDWDGEGKCEKQNPRRNAVRRRVVVILTRSTPRNAKFAWSSPGDATVIREMLRGTLEFFDGVQRRNFSSREDFEVDFFVVLTKIFTERHTTELPKDTLPPLLKNNLTLSTLSECSQFEGLNFHGENVFVAWTKRFQYSLTGMSLVTNVREKSVKKKERKSRSGKIRGNGCKVSKLSYYDLNVLKTLRWLWSRCRVDRQGYRNSQTLFGTRRAGCRKINRIWSG